MWTSLAQYAQRCVLLTRTGTPESAHRGITALFVDMDRPGITVRPIEAMHGRPSSPRCSSTTCSCPFERTLGDEGQGWAVAMDLLPYERSTALWHRGAFLHRAAPAAAGDGGAGALTAGRGRRGVPAAVRLPRPLAGPRSTAWRAGDTLGPETSVDKILLATAEQAVFDLAADGLADQVLLGDDAPASAGAPEFLYSRAATIYGGSAEIQRNIVARRLLDLGARPMMDADDRELFAKASSTRATPQVPSSTPRSTARLA